MVCCLKKSRANDYQDPSILTSPIRCPSVRPSECDRITIAIEDVVLIVS